MRRFVPSVLMGMALLAAPSPPSAEPRTQHGQFRWFSLEETMGDVARLMGPPVTVADFGDDFQSWHYRLGGVDEHDFSHYLVFRKSTGRLISVTRSYDPEQPVDGLFPAGETRVVFGPGPAPYGARVRKLPGSRVLIAMGSVRAGQPTGQLALVHESEVRNFFPWITR